MRSKHYKSGHPKPASPAKLKPGVCQYFCVKRGTGLRFFCDRYLVVQNALPVNRKTKIVLKPSLLSVLLFLIFQCSVRAQSRFVDQVYADANVGLFIVDYDTWLQFQAGLGYRINQRHAFGLSYHGEYGGNSYLAESIRGIGIDYRYSTDRGFITKVGIGKVLSGWAGEDNSNVFEFRSAKNFIDLSFAYQLRSGFTFGLYVTHSPELLFDVYLPASEVEPYPFDDDSLVFQYTASRQFWSFGLTFGYALPWRKKD